jgi:hypothetical protein
MRGSRVPLKNGRECTRRPKRERTLGLCTLPQQMKPFIKNQRQ